MAFAYLFFKKLAGSRMVAAAGALWLGTTWAYWAYSTDAIYIPVAAMFAGVALASFMNGPDRIFAMVAGMYGRFCHFGLGKRTCF